MLARSLRSAYRDSILYDLVHSVRAARAVRRWERAERAGPPPHPIKAAMVRDYAKKYGITTLVETGTCIGDMVHAVKTSFQRIYSIEVADHLYERAAKRFARDPHITILHGDSAKRLPEVLQKVDQPCLFWLDGHYSAGITGRSDEDTPVVHELKSIVAHPVRDHVILIDDARLFGTDPGYPSLEEVRALVTEQRPDVQFEVADDVIRVSVART